MDSSEILELENKLLHPTAEPISLPLYFLRLITDDFSNDQELGRGGYGVVYKGLLRRGNSSIAVKRIHYSHLVHDDQFQKEATFLMGIQHQNVIRFLGYCLESKGETMMLPNGKYVIAEKQTKMLCFEYMCKGGLDKYLSDESSGLEWNTRYKLIKGICHGLNFLHGCNIIHLDLKPENILMDSTMTPKIADFGLSRLLGEQKSYMVTVTSNRPGTMGYMAPEYINRGIISTEGDIFSLGVIIIEILTGSKEDYPDYGQSNEVFQRFIEKVLSNWRNRFESSSRYTPPELHTQLVEQCIDIALECVHPHKEKRPNVSNIIEILNAAEERCCVQNGKDLLVDHQQPECDICDGCHPSASTAKKRNDESSVMQKRDLKCQQESVNAQCNGYYTWEEIKTENGDNYFNASFHNDQRSKFLDYFVVVDFKATCDKGKQIKPQEIIEFSSVLINGSTGNLESTFHTYVRPQQHPKLTDYCRDLNGIRQKDVDAGVELAVALQKHGAWLQKMGTKKSSRFCFVVVTWGNWDCRYMLEPECQLKGIGMPPYFDRWINLKIPSVAAFRGSTRKLDLADAVRMAGIEWEGRPRGASDDAHNTALLLGELMRRGVELGITSSLVPMSAPQLL